MSFLTTLVISLFVLLILRLWFLQVMVGGRYSERAEDQSIRTVEVEAARGDIVDRDGALIVNNRYAQVVSVDPNRIGDAEERAETVHELARILNLSTEEINRRIDDERSGPYANRPLAVDVPDDVIFYIHQYGSTRFPGVVAERVLLREYPNGNIAAHVVGYTGQISAEELEEERYEDYRPGDLIGWAGVERTYERFLRGVPGERRVRVNHRGQVIEDLTDDESKQSLPGRTVQLTLDIDAQRMVEDALEEGILAARERGDSETGEGRGGTFEAPAGAAVVLEPSTGEIVAMASYPTFDPEEFVGGVSQTYWNYLQSDDSHYPLINRTIGGTYPPGSVYKIISVAAALENGFANRGSYIACPAEYEWGGNTYRNWNSISEGSLNLAESLMRSCDTVFYHLARQMYSREVNSENGQNYNERVVESLESGEEPEYPEEVLADMSRNFGFDTLTEIDLPGERSGVVPGREWRYNYYLSARDSYCAQAETAEPGSYSRELFTELCSFQGAIWRGGDLVNMSIGQGDVQVSPLQVANSFAAVVNRGTIMRPHVVRSVFRVDGTIEYENEPEVLTEVPVSEDNLAFIEQGLIAVTSSDKGTAHKVFDDFPLTIAGKTGTAENKPRQPYAWFAGYNVDPINDAQYVVVAFVEEGGGGSATAAPIVEKIFGGLAEIDVDLQAGEVGVD